MKRRYGALLAAVALALCCAVPAAMAGEDASLAAWVLPWDASTALTMTNGYDTAGQYGHNGYRGLAIDFAKRQDGIRLYAPTSGTVLIAGWDDSGYGNLVKIKTDDGFEVLMAHLANIDAAITVDGTVRKGQYLGTMGTTGKSTGIHLHLEIRYGSGAYRPAGNAVLFGGYTLADFAAAKHGTAYSGGVTQSGEGGQAMAPIPFSVRTAAGAYSDRLPEVYEMADTAAQENVNGAIRSFESYIWMSSGQYGGEDALSDDRLPSELTCSGAVRIGNILCITFHLDIKGLLGGAVHYGMLVDLGSGKAISARSLFSDWESAFDVIFSEISSQYWQAIGNPSEEYLKRSELTRAIEGTYHTYALDYNALYIFSEYDYLFDATQFVTMVPLTMLYPYLDRDGALGPFTRDRFERFEVVWP